MEPLKDDIRSQSRHAVFPWDEDGKVLSLDSVRELSKKYGVPGSVVEAEALNQGIRPLRYLRNQQGISVEEQIRLLRSRIALIGLGGLGGTLFNTFLRAGIGTIRCADGDVFEETNLNRQALCTPDNLGTAKTQAARDRADKINPSVKIESVPSFLTPKSLPTFVSGCDVVVDALGGLDDRRHLQHAAASANLPLISGALAGWTGYVAVVMPGETGPADFMGQDNGAEENLGCPAPSVDFIASVMAAQTLLLLAGSPPPLKGKMLVADLYTLALETVSIT